ncbi:MAG TPA: alpha/beta hydrolase [Candidatus Saccharimonadia bacterium]|nr:alpha/beta hydrolase [Candidatus Saccharimonadia bacterium]
MPVMTRVRYVCFPGLGQSGDIVWPQRSLPFDVVGIDPIEPVAGESLRSYSHRLARRVRSRGLFAAPALTLLAGVSFGASIAQEIAEVEPCAGVLVLSGLLCSEELAAPLRYIGHRAHHAPAWSESLVDAGAAFALRRIANVDRADATRCAAMIRSMPFGWIREQARMIADWRGCGSPAPVLRVHGDRDPVVPFDSARNVDVVLHGDRHLSSVARADEVNAAIVAFAARVVARPGTVPARVASAQRHR